MPFFTKPDITVYWGTIPQSAAYTDQQRQAYAQAQQAFVSQWANAAADTGQAFQQWWTQYTEANPRAGRTGEGFPLEPAFAPGDPALQAFTQAQMMSTPAGNEGEWPSYGGERFEQARPSYQFPGRVTPTELYNPSTGTPTDISQQPDTAVWPMYPAHVDYGKSTDWANIGLLTTLAIAAYGAWAAPALTGEAGAGVAAGGGEGGALGTATLAGETTGSGLTTGSLLSNVPGSVPLGEAASAGMLETAGTAGAAGSAGAAGAAEGSGLTTGNILDSAPYGGASETAPAATVSGPTGAVEPGPGPTAPPTQDSFLQRLGNQATSSLKTKLVTEAPNIVAEATGMNTPKQAVGMQMPVQMVSMEQALSKLASIPTELPTTLEQSATQKAPTDLPIITPIATPKEAPEVPATPTIQSGTVDQAKLEQEQRNRYRIRTLEDYLRQKVAEREALRRARFLTP